jgi:hypothetical protein
MSATRIPALALCLGFSVDAAAASASPTPKVVPTGYVEAYYAYNFARPSNRITNYRGYDNRSNTFSITNAVIGAGWESGDITGKVVLQVGSTASTEYLSEPALAGTSAVNATGPDVWKFIQEAYVGSKVPHVPALVLQAGVFLAPVGCEAFAVKDNWNWSRSNLFFGLWNYQTGARANYDLTADWSLYIGVYNGWNSVVDNNAYKSIQASVVHRLADKLLAQFLYFGGIERPNPSPEGNAWRNDFDLYARWDAVDWLSVMANVNAGFEPNQFGTSSWYAGAVYARVRPVSWLFASLRGDRFWEHLASNASGTAAPIFWGGASWVSELTVSVEVKPSGSLASFVEYRHDQAESPSYFRGSVVGSGTSLAPFVANSKTQDTVTIGATTWF